MPYILLIIYPKILLFLPKPGKWMKILKNILAIFLLFTILWLVFIIKNQTTVETALFTLVISVVIFYLLTLKTKNKFSKNLITSCILFLIISSYILIISVKHEKKIIIKNDSIWQKYKNLSQIKKIIKEDKIIFVNITADWCITCKINKFLVLNSKIIHKFFNENNIITIKADYTESNQNIYNLLKYVNRFAIPTYIIFSKKNPNGIVLKEILTKTYLQESFKKLEEFAID